MGNQSELDRLLSKEVADSEIELELDAYSLNLVCGSIPAEFYSIADILCSDCSIRAEEASRELSPLMDRMLEGQDRILQRIESFDRRMGGLEQRMENVETEQSILERNLNSIFGYDLFERANTSYRMKALPASKRTAPSNLIDHASTDPIPASPNYNWMEDLHNSWVYRKTARRLESGRALSVFTSESKKAASWSMLSGLNLYQVSSRSVLSLPVFAEDLSNAHAYQFGKISTARLLLPAFLRSHILAKKRMMATAGLTRATLKLKAAIRVDETEVNEDAELRAARPVPYRLV